METILIETNREGSKLYNNQFTALSLNELNAFFGILILRGVYRAAGESIDELWSAEHGRFIFRNTMSLNRFKLIRRILRFDNPDTRKGRLLRDKLAAVRLLIDNFVENSQKCYMPGESVTIDEQLYPYRGRCKFVQYMPSKPSKYGLKFWAVCDSQNYYCWNLRFYMGKEDDRDMQVSYGEYITMHMLQGLYGSGRNVTCDNFFTSLNLSKRLFQNGITMVGTVRASRRDIPKHLTRYQGREVFSTIELITTSTADRRDKALLVSYVAKKNKVVNILSTAHNKITGYVGSKHKPDVLLFYNATKGGVDAMDERVATYTTKFKCRRWHVAFFCNILDISAFNAFALHCLVEPQWNANKSHRRRLFLIELGNSLISAYVEDRRRTAAADSLSSTPCKRGDCYMCIDRKRCTVTCVKCDRFICKEHLHNICKNCS
jgi:hypothetical protein